MKYGRFRTAEKGTCCTWTDFLTVFVSTVWCVAGRWLFLQLPWAHSVCMTCTDVSLHLVARLKRPLFTQAGSTRQTECLYPAKNSCASADTLTPRAGGGALGRGSGHEGGALVMELVPYKAGPREPRHPPCADTARRYHP